MVRRIRRSPIRLVSEGVPGTVTSEAAEDLLGEFARVRSEYDDSIASEDGTTIEMVIEPVIPAGFDVA